uniref:Uncharacterized protein n=1 Tax=Hyaloperonospora arabidopsidis (strain Emoy2) TaxID=559515 RepID=M4BJ47_HYAAE
MLRAKIRRRGLFPLFLIQQATGFCLLCTQGIRCFHRILTHPSGYFLCNP